MTRKVVYNAQHGGFGLSDKALELGRELSGNPKWGGTYGWDFDERNRHDNILVRVVEELGRRANGFAADLQIATVEGKYRICEYDGLEWIETPETIEWVE